MSADVTEPIRMVLTLSIHCNTNLDLKRERKQTSYLRLPMTRCGKNKAHKRLDDSAILEKYAGIKIEYILETRPDQKKKKRIIFLNSACKKDPKPVGKPLTFEKKKLKCRPVNDGVHLEKW